MRSFFSTLPSVLIFTALASISLVDAAKSSGYSASHQHTPYNFGLGSPLLAPCRRRTFALVSMVIYSSLSNALTEIGGPRMCHRRRMRQQSSITQAEAAFLLHRITCTIRTNGTDWGDYPFIHRHRRIRYRYSSLRKMARVLAATFLYSSSPPGHTDLRETNAIPQP
ncbi:hypothetical protein DFH08DRAFT_967739 [Mycena albidolilacea]|uniref:Secreted protein n=1 Tax=Mycena albidolilacea TaxID=1033008 RepID=A0AAD6ZLX2_9AGAR|nr:hypothetical protein DFH08DRAFT_967739 [Mycena albidolilacea]